MFTLPRHGPLWFVLLLSLCACDPSQDQSKDAKEIAAKAIASVPSRTAWRSVVVRDASDLGYSLAIDYAQPPTPGEVEVDTERLARAILAQLMSAGHHPAHDFTVVRVSGVQSGLRGETGAELLRLYGTASYDPALDRVGFEVAR